MEAFIADVQFRFEGEGEQDVRAAVRRLLDVLEQAGFEPLRGKVVPATEVANEKRGGWTTYGPTSRDT